MRQKSIFTPSLVLVCALALTGCASKVDLKEDAADRAPSSEPAGLGNLTTAPTTETNANNASGLQPGTNTQAGSNGVASVTIQNKAPLSNEAATVLYFDYDSFAIKPEFESAIQTSAAQLKGDSSRKIVIQGHADARGGREYNLALGQKRADAVRQALTLLGVNEVQMESVSFGKEYPKANGNDEASHSRNRRAEVMSK